MGPMTGGGFGYCAGYDAPGFVVRGGRGAAGWGMGFGRGIGRGGGRGYRHVYYATGLPGWQRAGMAWGGPYGAPPAWYAGVPEDAEAIRAEAQRLEDAAARLRERADTLSQSED